MRITPPQPKVAWKTLAVTSKDPLVFAQELEGALQEMTDGGFNIISQMARDGAVIITGQRVDLIASPDMLALFSASQVPQAPGLRRRIVEVPSARSTGTTSDEVLYHYLAFGKQNQQQFATLVDALRVVQKHVEGPDDIVPISLITVTMTRFEPAALPALFKTFAEDLRADKPLE